MGFALTLSHHPRLDRSGCLGAVHGGFADDGFRGLRPAAWPHVDCARSRASSQCAAVLVFALRLPFLLSRFGGVLEELRVYSVLAPARGSSAVPARSVFQWPLRSLVSAELLPVCAPRSRSVTACDAGGSRGRPLPPFGTASCSCLYLSNPCSLRSPQMGRGVVPSPLRPPPTLRLLM